MRIFTLAIFAFLGSYAASFAQKVDLDRFYFDVSYLTLPREYIDPTERTFGVRVNTAPAVRQTIPASQVYDQVHLSGFRKVEDRPTVGVTINFGEVRFERSETKTRTQDRKDRDGKVIGQDMFYTMVLTYSASGDFSLYAPRESTASEKRQEEKQQAAVAQNRFLQSANLSGGNGSARSVTGDQFARTLTHTTREFSNLNDLNRYVKENSESIRMELINNYVQSSVRSVNNEINRWYGYVPYNERDFLWILDSKNHPEFPIQQEAIKAIKELMKRMLATEPLGTLEENLKPVMAYFGDLKTKYAGSDKREQKMRYSAYYNLATLYYLLDRPDEALTEAEGLIKNGYDTKDGERLAELATKLKNDLTRHRMDSRHMTL
ncbi:hypothetical protein F5984_12190 [Rudanella paleaurantiibacter]|uniref:Tetratricopeptide repeat protein n=1 Tax=Rudanella paleaurantiibacter TaxID=2614655 RepID=A0A7J5TZY9_9BACT|nr:hypothetical protein [Rudanella paleaurantiibacter]KAB7729940.1 hypothetical protein F5984_12190 [Rudanella paleaurantiibacter]